MPESIEPTEPLNEPVAPEPVVAAAPDAPAAPAAPEPSWSLKSAAQDRGIDPTAYETDQSLADAMFSALDHFQQNEPFVQIGRQFAPYADKLTDFQKWQQDQQKAPEPEPTPEPSFKWDAPEYDPRWETMVELDERGYYKAPDGIPSLMPVAEKMNTYRQFMTEKLNQFIRNPRELIQGATADELAAVEKRATENALKQFREELAERDRAAEMNAYVQKQAQDIWVHDETGNVKRNSQGQPLLTPKGSAMSEYAGLAEQLGITDPAGIRQFIDIAVQRDELSGRFQTTTPAVTPPVTPVTAPVPPAEEKKRFLRRVAASSNRGGSIPDPTAPNGSQRQNPQATMEEITSRIAREQGVQL